MLRSNWERCLVLFLLLLLLTGLFLAMFPIVWGAAMDKAISENAQLFLKRDEAGEPTSSYVSESQPEETIPYAELWEDMTAYKGFSILEKNFPTRDAALKWVQAYAKEKAKSGKTRYVPPQLANVHRTGPDYRNGAEITGQDYLDTFGFRGGEFGNWMNQNDRQVSLNMGFDALKDLASALQISDKDIAYGGKLAIAFGARGSGNAVAHYEPLRQVINLTKMHGAGSLAHEWWHGFDDYLGAKMGAEGFLSEHPGRYPLFQKLIDTMKYKQASPEQAAEKTASQSDRTRKNAESWLNYAVLGSLKRTGNGGTSHGYAIAGVEFSYLRIADLTQYTETAQDGSAKVQLLYGIDKNKGADFLNALSLANGKNRYEGADNLDETKYFYQSDVLIDALSAALTANATTVKNALETYVKANGGTAMPLTDSYGKTSATDLPVGLYLIVETKVPEMVISTTDPFLVSIPMTTVNGSDATDGGTRWMYDVTIFPKNHTGIPTLEKTLRENKE